jgi:hypothetical protein
VTERVVRVERFIPAAPEAIFDVLADPSRHREIDGSGTVQGVRRGAPERLSLGAKFPMSMKVGVPYNITNTVVEFEEGRLIAWQHYGRHIWRYRLEPVEGGTKVIEEFDYRPALFPWGLELLRYPQRHRPAMEATLARLAEAVTTRP